ncbi:exported hypothetical protein [Candidatus Sulfopaludibacter sp. SbA3]|nr:exported hypothetical protein [Candidatus Sulfopaludibacter sp. SbA3]
MKEAAHSRRNFLLGCGAAASSAGIAAAPERPAVSVVKIHNGNITRAVEMAIDLLGGIRGVAGDKERIMLKPNLVSTDAHATTKPEVIQALAQLMKRARKQVLIGEGSAAAPGFNYRHPDTFRTRKREILDPMQDFVFKQLGYTDLAQRLGIPLVNLHSGPLVEVEVPDAFVFPTVTIHRALTDIDLLCSVPMMKTHQLAQVTLGIKNLVGTFPGTVYQSVRGAMHDAAAKVEPSGTAAAIVDMLRANKLGLVVVDASTAMEGNGPTDGTLVKMDLIVAGTNPVATDMVASSIMGFEPAEVPTFAWANKAGLGPTALSEIEIRGEKVDQVRRMLVKPRISTWNSIRTLWGFKEV